MASQDRVPTGLGFHQGWSLGAGSDKVDAVDDPIGTPDDDTSYIVKADGESTETFTFTAFAIPDGSTIDDLTITIRTKEEAGGVGIRQALRIDGITYGGSSQFPTGSYADFTFVNTTNPDTGIAWTEADIEGTGTDELQQFGCRNTFTGAGEEVRVTQVYATVNYTEAGGGGRTTKNRNTYFHGMYHGTRFRQALRV